MFRIQNGRDEVRSVWFGVPNWPPIGITGLSEYFEDFVCNILTAISAELSTINGRPSTVTDVISPELILSAHVFENK